MKRPILSATGGHRAVDEGEGTRATTQRLTERSASVPVASASSAAASSCGDAMPEQCARIEGGKRHTTTLHTGTPQENDSCSASSHVAQETPFLRDLLDEDRCNITCLQGNATGQALLEVSCGRRVRPTFTRHDVDVITLQVIVR